MDQLAMGVREAAAKCGVSQSHIRRAINRGELAHIWRGERLLILTDDLIAWLHEGYDARRARPQRGQHLPPEGGSTPRRHGDDAEREASDTGVSSPTPAKRPRLSRVEGEPRRAPATARPARPRRRAHLDPWGIPDRMAS